MDEHALAILSQDNLWNWSNTKRIPESGKQGGKLESITHKLLYHLILESQTFGGDVLDLFWTQLANCNRGLKENIQRLKEHKFESAEKTSEVLFRGFFPKNIDYDPVLHMAAEFFTHLGIAFLNPGGKRSGTGTDFSISEIIDDERNKLLQTVNEEGDFGKRKQAVLKALCFKRDGIMCLLTHRTFKPLDPYGIRPALAHIIPHSVHGKPDTLKCIAMFAGAAARDEVVHNLNSIGNVMNMEQNAHTDYDDLLWGIEAKEEGGQVRYIFRMIPSIPRKVGPGFIVLTEGDEMRFGGGHEGERLKKGPIPGLCNLRLAVARVLKMSGAADIILEWKDQADDDSISRLQIAESDEFCDVLSAKLRLSGRVVVA